MPKRILIIYPNNILPIDTGSKKNTFEMIKELQSKGFNITLFCCVNQIKNSKEILNYVDRLVEYQNPLNNIFLKVVNKFLNVFINDMINENIILKFFLKKKFSCYVISMM